MQTAGRPELNKSLSRIEGKGKWLRRLLVLVLLGAVVAGVLLWMKKNKPPPAPRYVTATITTGDVFETIQSTGRKSMAFMSRTQTNTVRAAGATKVWRSPWKMPLT